MPVLCVDLDVSCLFWLRGICRAAVTHAAVAPWFLTNSGSALVLFGSSAENRGQVLPFTRAASLALFLALLKQLCNVPYAFACLLATLLFSVPAAA